MFFFPKRKPVIITYWGGELKSPMSLCVHSVSEYAKRWGLDHWHLRGRPDRKYPHPAWGKIEVLEELIDSKRPRVLYLDCDILVNKIAPNIFDLYEGNYMRRDPLVEYRWAREFEEWCQNEYFQTVACQPYFNTGVMLLERGFVKQWLRAIHHFPWRNHGTFEQHFFNMTLKTSGIEGRVKWLKSNWNWLNVTQKEFSRPAPRWFDHFASPNGKKILTQALAS